MATATLDSSAIEFRRAISRFATGVTVVTAYDGDNPIGMTASAVTSLSLDPLQLLVCISRTIPTHDVLQRTKRFAVNVLPEGADDLAMTFAAPVKDRFAGVALRDGFQTPVLDDAIAVFDCAVAEILPGGDHSIFVGQILQCDHDEAGRPLVYWASDFGKFRAS